MMEITDVQQRIKIIINFIKDSTNIIIADLYIVVIVTVTI